MAARHETALAQRTRAERLIVVADDIPHVVIWRAERDPSAVTKSLLWWRDGRFATALRSFWFYYCPLLSLQCTLVNSFGIHRRRPPRGPRDTLSDACRARSQAPRSATSSCRRASRLGTSPTCCSERHARAKRSSEAFFCQFPPLLATVPRNPGGPRQIHRACCEMTRKHSISNRAC